MLLILSSQQPHLESMHLFHCTGSIHQSKQQCRKDKAKRTALYKIGPEIFLNVQ